MDVQRDNGTFRLTASLDACQEMELVFPLEDLHELRQLISEILGE